MTASIVRRSRNPTHAMSSDRTGVIGLSAACIGVALRVLGATRPFDQPLWREGDLVAIARSFFTEDFNPLHPRVSWRGATNGLAEGEFPLVPWVSAAIWKITGERLIVLRLIPLVASLAALVVFWRLSSKYLRGARSSLAVAFVALSPLPVFLGSAVQSDGVMLLGILVAVWGALRWTEDREWHTSKRWPVVTVVGVELAGLMKLPALHIGVVVAAIIVLRHGWRSLIALRTLLIGVLALAGPIWWTVYAHSLYVKTGLSLGVSNEHHFAGTELFTNPDLIAGIVRHELKYVWTLGLIPAAYAIWTGRRQFIVRVATVWLLSVAAMLLVVGRTTGDSWAFYYHVAAVPPVAMLVGFGLGSMMQRVAALRDAKSVARQMIATVLSLGACVVVLLPGLRSSVGFSRPRPASALYRCAREFSAKVPDGLILTSGGIRLDDSGHAVASDASYMFEWLKRDGWTIAIEDQSLRAVQSFRSKGARAFVAEADATTQATGFESSLTKTYPVLAKCGQAATLFDLRTTR